MVGIQAFPIGAKGLFSGAFAVSFRCSYGVGPVSKKHRGDVISENPFWLIAALLLGIAFWHSTLARGASSLNGGSFVSFGRSTCFRRS